MMCFFPNKQSIYRIVISIAVFFFFQTAGAQVIVAGSAGTDGNYPTLNAAFTAINAAAPHTAATIVLTITASLNEGNNTDYLLDGSWNSLTIKPAVGAAVTITGATTAGTAFIALEGADNVTIDGLNTGGSSLTISNTTASAVQGTSTIWLVDGATNNLITNCTILGAYNGPVTSDGGTIWFGTDALTPNGNDNNTISNNAIGPVGANLPSKAIFSLGTSNTVANYNSGNSISGNTIYDFFSAGGPSAGIYIYSFSTQFTIQNNKLYQTATRTQTTSSSHSAIEFASNAQGNMVSGNTIGYSSAAGTGVYSIVGLSGTRFYPIHCAVATGTATIIQNNIISAISVSGNLSGSLTTAPFIGIYVSGLVTVSGNTIGSATVPGAITISSSNPSTISEIYGIQQSSTASMIITNNSIGGMVVSNTSTGGATFFGIRPTASVTSVISIVQNNTVGFANAPIFCNSTASNSRTAGIYAISGGVNITGNTVAYLTNNSSFPIGVNVDASLIGIEYQNVTATSASTISQNHVHSLSNTNTSALINVIGIAYNGPSSLPSTISKNFVHSLADLNNNVSGSLIGMYIYNGLNTASNNMISLGFDESGASVTGYMQIIGLRENNGTNQFYFNSVYIGGIVPANSPNSFAFYSSATAGSRDCRNNIFYNARSNSSGTGNNCAMFLAGSGPNPPGLTSNYNDLYATGTAGGIGYFNNVNHSTLAAWQAATGQDANSLSGNPSFINPAGSNTTVDLHIFTGAPIIESAGTLIAAITTDYDGQTRASLTPTDIGADAGDFFALPVIGTYPNTTITAGRNTTITPTSAPSYLMSAAAYTTAKLDGILTVNPTTGIVNVTDAMPAGTYTVFVKGFGGAGAVLTTFILTVTNPTCSQGMFYGTGSVPVANFPLNIAVGDFNNDGKQDIASPSYITNAVSIRLGDGLGGFSGTTEIPVGTSPGNLAVADFNGDGKQDLAVSNSGTTTVSVCLGNGLGGFTATGTVSVGTSPYGIVVGDFNNDGKPDLATANGADATVSVNLGDGLGGFGPQSLLATGSSPRSIQVGDFNEDGKQDIAVCCMSSSSVSIFLGNGAGAFTAQADVSVSTSPGSLVLADFNNDNHMDLATTSSGFFAASVRFGDGSGGFSGSTEIFINTNSSYGDLAVGDFNSDGNADLAITRFNTAEIAIQYGSGAGTFTGNQMIPTGGFSPHLPVVGDFNGDGIEDIAVANENGATVAIRLGGAADINLVGNAVNIPDGSTSTSLAAGTDFGSREVCGNSSLTNTFTFQNTGTTLLYVSGVSVTGTNAGDFIAYPSSFGINPGGTQNIFVVFDPSAVGARTAIVHFTNTDCDENTYDFTVRGTGTDPEIDVRGNTVSIVDGSPSTSPSLSNYTDFGNQSVCTGTLSRTFKIFNTGTAALTTSVPSLIGPQAAEFSITSPPAASVNPGDSTSMTITFNPTASGLRQAYLGMSNNDCDEPIFDFWIQGTGVDPEMNVKGNNTSIADGDGTPSTADFTNFGVACAGTVVKTFVIENTGTQSLSITGVTITGPNAADFSVITAPATSVPVAGSTSFQVRFTPGATGLRNATVTIANTDCDEAAYDFAINGTGTTAVTGSTVVTNVSCSGGSNGAINLTPAGGSGSYTFNWLPSGPTTEDRTGLIAGTYSVLITDVSGCTGTITATVTQPPAISVTASSQTNVSCFGGSNGAASINAATGGSGGFTYNWTPGNPSGDGTTSVTGLTAGTWVATTTDVNGCTAASSFTVTQPPAISVTASAQTNVSCFGGSNGAASINAATGGSGGFTYNWTPGNPTGDGTTSVTGLTAGTWVVTTTDANGCTATNSFTVTQPPAISVTASAQTNVSCFGGSNGAASINAATGGSGGFTYNWTPGNPTGDGTTSVTGLTAGTWIVTTTDVNGCSVSNTFNVTEPPQISFTASAQTNVSCFGGSNGAFQVNAANGGTGAFTYDWSPGNPIGDGTTSASGLTAGPWSVTATDANGCSATINFTITEPPQISVTASSQTNVSCFGGNNGAFSVNAALGGTGSFTYDWSPGNPTGDGTTSVSGLTAGPWSVTATDANGCSATINFTITEPSAISVTASSQTNVSCFGGSNGAASINAATGGSGGFTYNWTPGNPTGDGTTSVTGLTAGTWTVTTTDQNGCTEINAFTITEPPVLTGSGIVVSPVLCNGGNATVTVTASGGIAPYTGDGTFTEVAGNYAYTVTDNNGCTSTTSVTITEPTVLSSASSSTAILCNGGNATITVSASGGTSPYTGEGTFTQAAGTYSYNITDANGCASTTSVTITEPTVLSSTSTATSILCNGGNATVTVSASGGTSPYTGEGTFTEVAGTYSYTVTDNNGCTSSASITITEPSVLASASSTTSILCNGGNAAVTVTASGGTSPYSGEGTFTEVAGTYSYTVTDANGCTSSTSVTITEPTVLSVTISSAVNTTTCGGSNGSIDIDVTGGTPTYTFLWSNSDLNEDLTAIAAGSYNVIVTDANGCTGTVAATISDPAPPLVTLTLPIDTACGSFPGLINLSGESPAGGTFSGTMVSGNTFDPFAAGTGMHVITYTFTDVTGCTGSATDSLYVDPCTGIENIAETTWNLFPNPTTGAFTITASGDLHSDVIIEIYAADGKLVQRETKQQATGITLNLAGEPVGIYFIRITANEKVSVHRIVKI